MFLVSGPLATWRFPGFFSALRAVGTGEPPWRYTRPLRQAGPPDTVGAASAMR